MKKTMYIVLIWILVIALGASGVYVVKYMLDQQRDFALDEDLASRVHAAQAAASETTEAPSETGEETETTQSPYGIPGVSGNSDEYYTPDIVDEPEAVPEKPADLVSGNDFLPWYMELHDQNPDMVGWLKIEGTKVDYPVMQTSSDNANYYLYRNFDKEESIRGSIYAKEECDFFKPSDNITLFGHNMRDGSMFAYLGEYYNKETWEKNPMIFLDTLTESHVYKIFAVFKTSGTDNVGFAYHQMIDAKDEADFNEFIATCKRLAFYDTDITPVYGDKIICLSTCEYTIDDGRFVVAAVQIT